MLAAEKFKARLIRSNHPDSLLVGVDSKDDKQLYIIGNDGLGNINCTPIESFQEEIKIYVLEMISQSELYLRQDEKPVRIGHSKSIYSYSLKSPGNLSQTISTDPKMYFSSLFIRWQRTHQVSDKCAQDKLGLTVDEFHQFREDELLITQSLINKLAEVTGGSKQFWQNRWLQQRKSQGCNNEKI